MTQRSSPSADRRQSASARELPVCRCRVVAADAGVSRHVIPDHHRADPQLTESLLRTALDTEELVPITARNGGMCAGLLLATAGRFLRLSPGAGLVGACWVFAERVTGPGISAGS